MTLRTSESDPLHIYTFTVPEGGKIGMTICPGKHAPSYSGPTWQRDMDRDLDDIKAWGASSIFTILTAAELEAMAVTALQERVAATGLAWEYLDILDGGIPTEAAVAVWQGISPRCHSLLDKGEQVVPFPGTVLVQVATGSDQQGKGEANLDQLLPTSLTHSLLCEFQGLAKQAAGLGCQESLAGKPGR